MSVTVEHTKVAAAIQAVNTCKVYFLARYKQDFRSTFSTILNRVLHYNSKPETAMLGLKTNKEFQAYCTLMNRDYETSIRRVLDIYEVRKNATLPEPDDILQWWMTAYRSNCRVIPDKVRREREARFFKEYTYISISGGDCIYTTQRMITATFYKKEHIGPQLTEVAKAFAFIEPIPENAKDGYGRPCEYAGYKVMAIMEQSCSRYGSYCLYLKGNECLVVKCSYGSNQEVFKGDLSGAVAYCIHRVWYEKNIPDYVKKSKL